MTYLALMAFGALCFLAGLASSHGKRIRAQAALCGRIRELEAHGAAAQAECDEAEAKLAAVRDVADNYFGQPKYDAHPRLVYIRELLNSPRILYAIEHVRASREHLDTADAEGGASHPECNHHHPVSDDHEWVDFGHGAFVANRKALPLLRALHALGLRTRTHHIADGDPAFVSILLDDGVTVDVRKVHETDATRTKYNGMTEVLISW